MPVGRLSRKFRILLKLSPTPNYRLALDAGMPISRLYRIASGQVPADSEDPQLRAIAARFDLPVDEIVEREGA